MSKSLQATWEKTLKAEGLGHLDHVSPDDPEALIVSNRGSGKLRDAAAQQSREAQAARLDRDREILRTYRFASKTDKEIWRQYSNRLGYQTISKNLNLSQHKVRRVISFVTRDACQPKPESIDELIAQSSPVILVRLLEILLPYV